MSTCEEGTAENRKSFKDILAQGILEREKGSVEKSVLLFKEAISLAPSTEDAIGAKLHLGLALFHKGKLSEAKDIFTSCIVEAEKINNISKLAEAQRHLSRKEFYKGSGSKNLQIALDYATDAYSNAKFVGRKDLVWFTHGLIDAYTEANGVKNKSYLRKIFLREVKEFFITARKEGSLERSVWLYGLMIDFIRSYAVLSLLILKIALYFAKKQGLTVRVKQIEKLIKTRRENG